MFESQHIYTPSELNREARLHIEAGFASVWVEGEIADLRRPSSGHLYFSLKDERAQIRCALFRSSALRLACTPKDGMLVRARGRLSLFEQRGQFQLIADTLEESGEGRLRAAFEALKLKLHGEGLFDAGAKQALPGYPARIAVVTSASGAVIRDILQVTARRWPLAAVRLYPVPVQGAEAPGAIIAALGSANRHGWADAIILGRGGGSLEDLSAFNDEGVARAVFASRIPVVSAVGHETDFAISDFVADARAPTPSAAAEMLTPDRQELIRSFAALGQQLARRMRDHLLRRAQQHDHLAHRLSRQHPGYRLAELGRNLDQFRARLTASGRNLVPPGYLALERCRVRLLAAGRRLVPERQSKLGELARTLHAVSPLPTLERGYAMVMDAGAERAISSIRQVEPGDSVVAQLRDGRLHTTVERTSGESLVAPAKGETDRA